MLNIDTLKREWLSNPRRDLLSGTVVALALIPEAIAFSIIAGVDPAVGLYASFVIAVTISIVGGRPAMISAATGAMSLLMVTLVKDHGLEYLFAASILTGVFQIVIGALKLGSLIRFVSRSVMTGFVNALAILIFMAQLPELTGVNWQTYALVAAGLGIIYGFPYITKAVPSPLVAILTLTGVVVWAGIDVRTVGDMGQMPTAFPGFHLPSVPLTWETLAIIAPISATLAFVGLLESLLTANIVDDMTDTPSDKDREARGQGIANILSPLFGGMAGCAMIGQSVINVKSGGRGRLSTLWAGLFLLFLILVLQQWVAMIPMAVLVAVMIMVSVGTFDWNSIRRLGTTPKQSSAVMIVTTLAVVLTHDLSKGVILGVIMSAIFFALKVSKLVAVERVDSGDNDIHIYRVQGQIFFVSADLLTAGFEFHGHSKSVTIDLTHARIWDITAVDAIDKIVFRYRRHGAEVNVIGMSEACSTLVGKVGQFDKTHLPSGTGH
ncbi:SulP family inorganic anion transporter [Asticcacaulis sp. ZE23SCel15]|uniref:SulP family inorganic anion transporter n=1 Tax=Asticcacaulis sp. ZE23SCel15 TaxID=3059027 RepID=UPI00265E7FFE|nr:SulP family inorganic anion transporter [Asticcacaulis sp. ZE23SCel15]WKL55894.1 SulP family inorganic anion transporter [Asticcacaulis sp. ZE23SCel15]